MTRTEPTPYNWEMHDSAVLAHRIGLPAVLPAYAAVTVAPGQQGLVFLGSEQHLLRTAGLHMITGSLIHSLAEGYELAQTGTEAVLPYNAQLTLFDVRQKLWHAQPIDLIAASGEHTAVNLSLSYCIDDVIRLNGCGADYVPCEGGSEMRLDDPKIADAFQRAISDVTLRLQQRAAEKAAAKDILALLAAPALRTEIRVAADAHLAPIGLKVTSPHLSSAHASCPYCQKQLSLLEIRQRRCSAVDEEGNPQPGCGRTLHACPSCQTIVGPERSVCPTCAEELLFCYTPGCSTYRRVERGRFCPVCKRACYPIPDREFLTLM